MKKIRICRPATIPFSLLLLFFCRIPSFATAGLAEFDRDYHYNDYTDLWWGHTDLCSSRTGSAGDCFYLKSMSSQRTLEEISVPPDKSSPFVLAKTFDDRRWIVVDLRADKTLADTNDFENALKVWESLGLKKPTIVGVGEINRFFKEAPARTWMEYRYNRFTDLWWERSDHCSDGKGFSGECFYMTKDPEHARLRQINLPESDDSPFVIAQTFHDNAWFLMNSQTATKLLSTFDFNEAMSKWSELGRKEPKLVTANDLSKVFSKTDKSKRAQTAENILAGFGLVFLIGILVVAAAVLFGFFYFLFIIYKRFRGSSTSQLP